MKGPRIDPELSPQEIEEAMNNSLQRCPRCGGRGGGWTVGMVEKVGDPVWQLGVQHECGMIAMITDAIMLPSKKPPV